MLLYPSLNPIAFHIGSFPVHWYGLMYLVGFLSCWSVLALRIKRAPTSCCPTREALSDILFYAAVGIIVGGRIGYMVFYNWDMLITYPLSIIEIWKGGMSFHGGLIGVMLAIGLYAYRKKQAWLDITDFIAPVVPIGLAAGRLGNFINGELWGRVTDMPWGMVFPDAGELPRHPSQVYEFLLEGVILFIVLWTFSSKPRPRGAVSGLFLIGYGVIRFVIEFYREPDIQLGFVAFGWLTQGQLLCLPMIICGLGLMVWANQKSEKKHATIS